MYDLTNTLTDERIEEIAERISYPKLHVEFLGWLMDTAHKLHGYDFILKGGTAVQQFIRNPYRRISMDLDYNLGREMSQGDVRKSMEGLDLRGGRYNRFTGTLTYYHVAPTIYKSETRFEGEKITPT